MAGPMAAGSQYDLAVVGGGRVGRALADMCCRHAAMSQRLPAPFSSTTASGSKLLYPSSSLAGVSRQPSDLIIRRGQRVAPDQMGPIFVATQNHDLPGVIEQIPEARRQDLVLLQNGYFAPVLEEHGLAEDGITQVLLYMSASDKGEMVDGRLSVSCGRWAEASAAVLRTGGVMCSTAEPEAYAFCQAKKLLWASIFWAVCHALGGLTVGEVAAKHREEVRELVAELLPRATALFLPGGSRESGSRGTEAVPPGDKPEDAAAVVALVTQELCDYSSSIAGAVPSKDMAIREFRWRNGALLMPPDGITPLHADWLVRAGCPEELLIS